MRSPVPWFSSEPDDVRGWITDVNDGIITVAGMGLGMAGAEVVATTAEGVISINAFVGALTVFGVKLGERLSDREAEQDLVEHESQNLAKDPREENAELVDWFVSKGVTPTTARSVTRELADGDALGAQLVIEYGLTEPTTLREAWFDAGRSGLAFFLGALMPLLATILTPWNWHTYWTIGIVAVLLTLTSFVLSRLGHSNTRATVARSLTLGVATLAISYLLGDLLL